MISAEILARSGEGWKSGPMGFAIILLLCIACYFLFKSMSKHMRKVREEFPAELPGPPAARSARGATATPAEPAAPDAGAPDTESRS
jgi:hypothetical protein